MRVRSFDDTDCRDAHDRWDKLTKADRRRLLASGGVLATRDTYHRNATCEGLHRALAKLLAGDPNAPRPALVALGDDWGGGTTPDADAFTPSDTTLNNKVGEITLSDPAGVGTRWAAQELVGSLELVDETIREWGVILSNGALANHGPVNPAINRSDKENTLLDLAIPFTNSD